MTNYFLHEQKCNNTIRIIELSIVSFKKMFVLSAFKLS